MITFEELLTLDNYDIDIYPNKTVEKNYNNFIQQLNENNLTADRISLLLDGGVCFLFKKNNNIYFEIYNDGQMGFIIEDPINKKIIENKDINNFKQIIQKLNKP